MQTFPYILTSTTQTVREPTGLNPRLTPPLSVTMVSADSSRAIAIMTSADSDWYTLTPDLTSTNSITVALLAPVYDIRGTGIVDDILEITQ